MSAPVAVEHTISEPAPAHAPAFAPRATVWTLAAPTGGPQSNPPSNPTAVAPVQSSAPWVNGGNWTVPASAIVFVGLTVA